MPVVVCVNQFHTDTQNEIDLIIKLGKEYGAFDAVMSTHWAHGGKGAVPLAESLIRACEASRKNNEFKFLY